MKSNILLKVGGFTILGILIVAGIFVASRYTSSSPEVPAEEKISKQGISNASATKVITYTPIQAPTEVRKGSCWTGSLAMPFRSDAWRCQPENRSIEDPCFVFEAGISLVCDPDPTSEGEEYLLDLTERLPLSEANKDREAPSPWGWFIELIDGTTCRYIGGATGIVNEKRINFSCTNDTVLLGTPQKEEIWKIEQISLEESRRGGELDTELVSIKTIWQ